MVNRTAVLRSKALTASVLIEDSAFESLRGEWDSLADDSGRYACSLRCEWNRLWWRYFAPSGSHLFLIACRDEHHTLVGLAPFYLHTNHTAGLTHQKEVRFIGTGHDIALSDRQIMARRSYEQEVAVAVADCLRQGIQSYRLWLSSIPADSKTLTHFQCALGNGARATSHFHTLYIAARTDWTGFKATLSSKTRQEIDRRTRRLFESHDCRFRRATTEAEFDEAMSALIKWHRARWQIKDTPDTLDSPKAKEFLYALARWALVNGRLRLWTLTVDGQIAAVELAFFDNGAVHFLQRGFNPGYAKESVGTLTMTLCIRESIESNEVNEIILGSRSVYKTHWTKTTWENIELTIG
jgi:CelD/BcsL family acetyltransferase involved in cellulose biosynthesis